MMTDLDQTYTALVLAGERPGKRSVAEAAGVCCKALAPVGGEPMVLRVLDSLGRSSRVGRRILSGLPVAAIESVAGLDLLRQKRLLDCLPGADSPSASTAAALDRLDRTAPVLLTTADHALLDTEMVDHFCLEAMRSKADLVVGLARYSAVSQAFPGVRRTVTKMSDDGYCGCNLFAFLTPESRRVATVWRSVEQHRKQPWRVVSIIGWGSVLRYLLRRLSLQQALDRLSLRLGVRVGAVIMPPAASVDVDTVEDWALVQRLATSERDRGRRPDG